MWVQIAISVIAGLLIAILTGLMTYFRKQAKQYKDMLASQKEAFYRQLVHEEIKPLERDLGELRTQLLNLQAEEHHHLAIIQGQYKFRLIHLCRTYIRQGYLTEDQYECLSEFFKVYTDLGGNGQAQEFYERVMQLPIHD